MFYKLDGAELIGGETVAGPDYILLSQDHGNYTYPIYGWYWFDTQAAAEDAFRLRINGIPQYLSAFQARAALLQAGLLSQAEVIINDIGTDELIRLAWQTNVRFHRNSPAVIAIGSQLGLTKSQLDELFITGSAITV